VCYRECEVRPVRVSPAGCGCDDVSCDYSRIRDAYEFSCLDCPPPVDSYDCGELCQGGIQCCPSCPQSNCVGLATIRLRGHFRQDDLPPSSDAYTNVPAPHYGVNPASVPMLIDNFTDRKLLYSTSALQAMAMCQCGGFQPPAQKLPAPVVSAVR